ncbi:MAG: hypothetical protein IKW74_00700 [Thermoguttaceae bacterium]|nr:hypothetical protein [Thermoguttaceae bacterium]
MTKYSGFMLSLLLVLICLWVNICRYPSVWMMLKGTYVQQINQQEQDVVPNTSVETGEKGQLVSNGVVVPVPAAHTENQGHSTTDPEAHSENIFSHANYEAPVSENNNKNFIQTAGQTRDSIENQSEKPGSEKNENDPQSQNPSEKKSDRFVTVSTDVTFADNSTTSNKQRSILCTQYCAAGGEGTFPMNLESPSYSLTRK